MSSGVISQAAIQARFGFNARTVMNLVEVGVLELDGRSVRERSLSNLREQQHYVVCQACGAFVGQLVSKHTRACSGISLGEYLSKWPSAPILSDMVAKRKEKTPAQKQAQSEKLKRRFQTPEGEITRRQIAAHAKLVQDSGYREKAAEHLRRLNNSPEQRAQTSERSKAKWQDPDFRAKINDYQRTNRDGILAAAAKARGHIQKTFTKPHRIFEEALLATGLEGLVREHPIAFYHIDEACPELKLALEIDGCYWHGCNTCGFPGVPGSLALDKRKQTYLVSRGWTLLRFPEHLINSDLSGCVEQVLQTISTLRDRHEV
jgi:DNA mismatch endonuclease (patch repair protein)